MADLDNVQDGKNYYLDVPPQSVPSRLKGSNALDWGMKNRLARIFDPRDARTVMLAIDHGYFQGPTTGLERIDVTIVPLISYADALMVTRGGLRSSIPAEIARPVVLRSSGGQSILKELSNELVAVDIDDAIRLNASALAVQVYIGGVHEHESIGNLVKVVDSAIVTAFPRWPSPAWAKTWYGMPSTWVSLPDMCRNGCPLCEDLLLRERLFSRHCRLPGSIGHRGGEKAT